MKTVILVQKGNKTDVYTGFKKMYNLLNLPYNYLKRFKYPINYKDLIIDKVELK